MSWEAVARVITGKAGAGLVKEVCRCSTIFTALQTSSFSSFNKVTRHGSWGQTRHVRDGKITGALTPVAMQYVNRGRLSTPTGWLDFVPHIRQVDAAGSFDCTYKRTGHRDQYSQREFLLGLGVSVDSGLAGEPRILGANTPENIPGDTLNHHKPQFKAVGARGIRDGIALYRTYSLEKRYATAALNLMLINAIHNKVYYKGGRELVVRHGRHTFPTHYFLSHLLFGECEFDARRRVVEIELDELLVGTSVWLTDDWLLPIPMMIKGVLKLEGEKASFRLKAKHASAPDSKYRELDLSQLPRRADWQLLNPDDFASSGKAIITNLAVVLRDHVPGVLDTYAAFKLREEPRLTKVMEEESGSLIGESKIRMFSASQDYLDPELVTSILDYVSIGSSKSEVVQATASEVPDLSLR